MRLGFHGWHLVFLFTACHSGAPRHVEARGALGPYSAAVVAGDLVFLSGKIGSDMTSFESEARSTIDAVRLELERVGLLWSDVVTATVYLTDMSHYAELNRIYAELIPAPHPARACIAVAALPKNARIEIQVVAARGGS